MTLREYTLSWLEHRTARLTPNGLRAYRSALLLHVLRALGETQLSALTTRQIRHWLQAQVDAGRATNSVKAAHGALSTVLTDAQLDGLVPGNAAHGAGRRMWPGRGKAAVPKALKPHELAALLAASRQVSGGRWAHDLFVLAAMTGLRLGELLALQACHVSFDDGVLRVEHTYHGVNRFGPTKNQKARLVELSPATLELLKRLVARAGSPEAFLFPGRRPGPPLHPATVEWAFDRAVTLAGLATRYTIHNLRHTYCSTLLAHGAPAQWVQRQVGHAHYATTVDIYGSWLREPRPDLVAILDRQLRPAEVPRRTSAKVISLAS